MATLWTEKSTNQKCQAKTEVYSRVCGYFRPVANWNKGKKSEFNDRKSYTVPDVVCGPATKAAS